jgi:uncharacterized protein YdhG (YjbR/CyaY superfamily)
MTSKHQEFLSTFEDERQPLVEVVLEAIIEECPGLTETIKWNAPTFVITERPHDHAAQAGLA